MAKKTASDAPAPEIDNDDFLNLGDVSDIETPAFGSDYVTAQWVNGSPKYKQVGGLAYHGGVFISADQDLAGVPEGFEETSFTTQDGKEIKGYWASEVTVAPIRTRRCWGVQQEEDSEILLNFPWNEYELAKEIDFRQSPTSRGNILVKLRGYAEPVILTCRGMVQKRFLSSARSDTGIIPEYGRLVLNAARSVSKRKNKTTEYPLFSFWLTIGGERDGDGPKITMVGDSQKSAVVMPEWRNKPTGPADEAYLRRNFVGSEVFTALKTDYHDSVTWQDAWSPEVLTDRIIKRGGGSRRLADHFRKEDVGMASEGEPEANSMPF